MENAGFPVIDDDQYIAQAYTTSATHVVMVVGAKSKAGSSGSGTNILTCIAAWPSCI